MKKPYKGTHKQDNIGELGDDFFKVARRVGRPMSEHPKERISIRLSPEVTAYFRATGPGWQSRIDAMLREMIASQQP